MLTGEGGPLCVLENDGIAEQLALPRPSLVLLCHVYRQLAPHSADSVAAMRTKAVNAYDGSETLLCTA